MAVGSQQYAITSTASVTSSTGLKIAHGTALVGPFTLFAGDTLYAVTASTATVEVVQT